MRLRKTIGLMALGAVGAALAQAQAACSAMEAIRVGMYDTQSAEGQPDLFDRVGRHIPELPTAVSGLDALCLNSARVPQIRDLQLQRFSGWNMFHPTPVSTPGCQKACSDQSVGNSPPLNDWTIQCAITISYGGRSCYQAPSDIDFRGCMNRVCPDLTSLLATQNPTCPNCLDMPVPGENREARIRRCATEYAANDSAKCKYGVGGEAGATLLSRFPFLETDYREFTSVALPLNEPGMLNFGITYGKVQTPIGPVHLFCSSLATLDASIMKPGTVNSLNALQGNEALNYIRLKAGNEAAVFLANTGSGPAVASSATGPAQPQQLGNFAILQSGLTDALLANLDADSRPAPVPACTYPLGPGAPYTSATCGNTASAGYVDHIMTAGRGTLPGGGAPAPLCHRNGGLFLTNIYAFRDYSIPLSPHAGVATEISVLRPVAPKITWNRPTSIVFGSALGNGQLNAIANTPGRFTYTPAAGTIPSIGQDQPLRVQFVPDDTVNYTSASASTMITVTPSNVAGVNIVAQRILSRNQAGEVVARLTIINNGGTNAANVVVNNVRLGTVQGTPATASLGPVNAGGMASVDIVFPGTAGLAAGAANTFAVGGTYTGGTFSSAARVVNP